MDIVDKTGQGSQSCEGIMTTALVKIENDQRVAGKEEIRVIKPVSLRTKRPKVNRAYIPRQFVFVEPMIVDIYV